MELHLSGFANTKLYITIAEGPQVGPRLTKGNANVDPFWWCLSAQSKQFKILHNKKTH